MLCCLCRRGAVLSCISLAILCGAVPVFYLVSLHPVPDARGLAVPDAGGLVILGEELVMYNVQCDTGTISRVVGWSSLRKATQSYLVGSSLRTAMISGSSSLPVGVNMVR